MSDHYADHAAFMSWLASRVICDARGDDLDMIEEAAPRDRFWLGRIASEEAARKSSER